MVQAGFQKGRLRRLKLWGVITCGEEPVSMWSDDEEISPKAFWVLQHNLRRPVGGKRCSRENGLASSTPNHLLLKWQFYIHLNLPLLSSLCSTKRINDNSSTSKIKWRQNYNLEIAPVFVKSESFSIPSAQRNCELIHGLNETDSGEYTRSSKDRRLLNAKRCQIRLRLPDSHNASINR